MKMMMAKASFSFDLTHSRLAGFYMAWVRPKIRVKPEPSK